MNYNEKIAYEKGYRIDKDGNVIGLKGKILKPWFSHSGKGYKMFSCRLDINTKPLNVAYHRLQAYQKFKEEIYKENILVRHLNGNSLDNSWDNIDIGTQSDNMYDIPKKERLSHAIIATAKWCKYKGDIFNDIINDREKGLTYTELMEKYNISSKGTLHHILNKRKYIK